MTDDYPPEPQGDVAVMFDNPWIIYQQEKKRVKARKVTPGWWQIEADDRAPLRRSWEWLSRHNPEVIDDTTDKALHDPKDVILQEKGVSLGNVTVRPTLTSGTDFPWSQRKVVVDVTGLTQRLIDEVLKDLEERGQVIALGLIQQIRPHLPPDSGVEEPTAFGSKVLARTVYDDGELRAWVRMEEGPIQEVLRAVALQPHWRDARGNFAHWHELVDIEVTTN